MLKVLYIISAALLSYLLLPTGGTYFYVMGVRWIYILMLSFLTAFLLTPIAIWIGKKFKLLDYPNERKIHDAPVPVTGGIVVFLTVLITLIRNMNFSSEIIGILLGGGLLFLMGIADDIKPISARVKFVLQVAVALIVVKFGVQVRVVPLGFPLKDALDILITVTGIVGIINAFNYMDGMDGEAPGLAVITGLTLFFIALQGNERYAAWLAIALVGTNLGFLFYNFPKAKIFLGDNGATLIGFLLATMAITVSWDASDTSVAIVTPLLIFSIFIFDLIYTTLSRIKNKTVSNLKEWLEVTGKDHLHHRLANLGFSRVHSVFIIWIIASVFCISAFIIRHSKLINSLLIMVQAVSIYILVVVLMLLGRKKEES